MSSWYKENILYRIKTSLAYCTMYIHRPLSSQGHNCILKFNVEQTTFLFIYRYLTTIVFHLKRIEIMNQNIRRINNNFGIYTFFFINNQIGHQHLEYSHHSQHGRWRHPRYSLFFHIYHSNHIFRPATLRLTRIRPVDDVDSLSDDPILLRSFPVNDEVIKIGQNE